MKKIFAIFALFINSWAPPKENLYSVYVTTRCEQNNRNFIKYDEALEYKTILAARLNAQQMPRNNAISLIHYVRNEYNHHRQKIQKTVTFILIFMFILTCAITGLNRLDAASNEKKINNAASNEKKINNMLTKFPKTLTASDINTFTSYNIETNMITKSERFNNILTPSETIENQQLINNIFTAYQTIKNKKTLDYLLTAARMRKKKNVVWGGIMR